MSRPAIDEKDKRVIQVNIRLTLPEHEKVLFYSQASGHSPANWIRRKIFTGRFPDVKLSPIDAALYQELHRIGMNLNQAVHKVNTGEIPSDLRNILLQLLAQKKEIIQLLIHDSKPDKR